MHHVCLKLRKTSTEIYKMLQKSCGDEALIHFKTFQWFGWLKCAKSTTIDDLGSCRQLTSHTMELVAKILDKFMIHEYSYTEVGKCLKSHTVHVQWFWLKCWECGELQLSSCSRDSHTWPNDVVWETRWSYIYFLALFFPTCSLHEHVGLVYFSQLPRPSSSPCSSFI